MLIRMSIIKQNKVDFEYCVPHRFKSLSIPSPLWSRSSICVSKNGLIIFVTSYKLIAVDLNTCTLVRSISAIGSSRFIGIGLIYEESRQGNGDNTLTIPCTYVCTIDNDKKVRLWALHYRTSNLSHDSLYISNTNPNRDIDKYRSGIVGRNIEKNIHVDTSSLNSRWTDVKTKGVSVMREPGLPALVSEHKEHGSNVTAIITSPNLCVTGDSRGKIVMWDCSQIIQENCHDNQRNKTIATFTHLGIVLFSQIVVTKHGNSSTMYVAVGYSNNSVAVIDLTKQCVVKSLGEHRTQLRDCCICQHMTCSIQFILV